MGKTTAIMVAFHYRLFHYAIKQSEKLIIWLHVSMINL